MMAMMQNIMIINETTTTKTVHIQQERIRRSLSEFQSIKFASNTESVSSHTDSWNMEDDQDLLQEVMRVQMIVDRFKITDTGAYSHGSINTLAHTHAGSIDTVIHAVHAACTNFDLKKLILDAKNSDTIITILELAGFESVASRLRYLKEITDEDTEDPPIDVESLRLSVLFMAEYRNMPKPQIVTSYDGRVYLRWTLDRDEGVLGMEFSPSHTITFTAILHVSDSNSVRRSSSGVLPQKDAINAVRWFIDMLVP